jgi:hypothetical protein
MIFGLTFFGIHVGSLGDGLDMVASLASRDVGNTVP